MNMPIGDAWKGRDAGRVGKSPSDRMPVGLSKARTD